VTRPVQDVPPLVNWVCCDCQPNCAAVGGAGSSPAGGGGAELHTLFEQVVPVAQTLPHVPQLPGSLVSVLHTPPQRDSGAGHGPPPRFAGMQVPPEHVSSGGQMLPQKPQLFGSICGLLHWPPHSSPGGGQLVIGAHVPPWQMPDGHVIPHMPQLFGSVETL